MNQCHHPDLMPTLRLARAGSQAALCQLLGGCNYNRSAAATTSTAAYHAAPIRRSPAVLPTEPVFNLTARSDPLVMSRFLVVFHATSRHTVRWKRCAVSRRLSSAGSNQPPCDSAGNDRLRPPCPTRGRTCGVRPAVRELVGVRENCSWPILPEPWMPWLSCLQSTIADMSSFPGQRNSDSPCSLFSKILFDKPRGCG